jgi:hypothetical protein
LNYFDKKEKTFRPGIRAAMEGEGGWNKKHNYSSG